MTMALPTEARASAYEPPLPRNRLGGVAIELAGCSGAGKSTLLAALLHEGRERGIAMLTVQQALLPWLPPSIGPRRPSLQNLALDVAGVRRALAPKGSYGEFLRFACGTIARDTDRRLRALNAYRAVLRAVGIHAALCGDRPCREIVVVDEGTVNCAHAVLAHVRSAPKAVDVDTFCRLVPMPDVVVHVSAPLDLALARTRRRPDPPLPGRSPAERAQFLRHANDVFEQMMRHQAFSTNTLRVTSDGDDRQQYRNRAREILDRIA